MLVKFLLLLTILIACTKKPEVYSTTEVMDLVLEHSDVSEVFISEHTPELRVICENYGEGCVPLSGKRFRLKGVDFLMIQFETPELARAEAKKLNQWVLRNWLLDDVQGEPILESFAQTILKAERP